MLLNTLRYPNLQRYRGIPIAITRTENKRFTPLIGYSDDTDFKVEVYCLPSDPLQSYSSFDLAWKAAELAIDEIHQLLEIGKHTEEDQDYAGVKLLPEAIVRLGLKLK